MSKLATYFKESVSVLKKGLAYARVVPVLLLALLKRLTGDGRTKFNPIAPARQQEHLLKNKVIIIITPMTDCG